MANFRCPYAKIVPLKCDAAYELTQFYKYLEHIYKSGKVAYIQLDKGVHCLCDPELCPRYVQHMVANIQKYKHR